METKKIHVAVDSHQASHSIARLDDDGMDISFCRVRRNIAGLVECMVPNSTCPHKLSYGHFRFCRHPLSDQIAESSVHQPSH